MKTFQHGFERIRRYNAYKLKYFLQKVDTLYYKRFFQREINFKNSLKNPRVLYFYDRGDPTRNLTLEDILSDIQVAERLLENCEEILQIVEYSIEWCQNQLDTLPTQY